MYSSALTISKDVSVRALWVSKMGKRIDLVVVYKILLALKEHGGSLNVTQLIKAIKSSGTTVERYVEILKSRGLVEEKSNRERRIYITKKGEDYIFLFSRLLAVFGELR